MRRKQLELGTSKRQLCKKKKWKKTKNWEAAAAQNLVESKKSRNINWIRDTSRSLGPSKKTKGKLGSLKEIYPRGQRFNHTIFPSKNPITTRKMKPAVLFPKLQNPTHRLSETENHNNNWKTNTVKKN